MNYSGSEWADDTETGAVSRIQSTSNWKWESALNSLRIWINESYMENEECRDLLHMIIVLMGMLVQLPKAKHS